MFLVFVFKCICLFFTKLKREPTVVKNIQINRDQQCEGLQDCFEQTDWNVFYDACSSSDELAETISDYIAFCESNTSETKSDTGNYALICFTW